MQYLFAESFASQKDNSFIYRKDLTEIKTHLATIDQFIEKAAPQFPVDKIAKIDVAILRLAIYELFYEKKEPPKVIIDESVELAKEFGGSGSSSFVNGVLGHLLSENHDKS